MTRQNPTNDDTALQKDPEDWKTGDEPMTPAQRSYLETLARDSGETIDEDLTKAEASKRIDEANLSRATLEGAFDVLRELTHANIVVRWPALVAVFVNRRSTP